MPLLALFVLLALLFIGLGPVHDLENQKILRRQRHRQARTGRRAGALAEALFSGCLVGGLVLAGLIVLALAIAAVGAAMGGQ